MSLTPLDLEVKDVPESNCFDDCAVHVSGINVVQKSFILLIFVAWLDFNTYYYNQLSLSKVWKISYKGRGPPLQMHPSILISSKTAPLLVSLFNSVYTKKSLRS